MALATRASRWGCGVRADHGRGQQHGDSCGYNASVDLGRFLVHRGDGPWWRPEATAWQPHQAPLGEIAAANAFLGFGDDQPARRLLSTDVSSLVARGAGRARASGIDGFGGILPWDLALVALHDALLHAAQSDSPNEGFHWGAILNTTRAGHPGSHWFSLFVYCPPSMVPTPVPADGVADDAAGSAPPGPSDDGAPGGVVADGRDGGVERGDGDANLAPADFSRDVVEPAAGAEAAAAEASQRVELAQPCSNPILREPSGKRAAAAPEGDVSRKSRRVAASEPSGAPGAGAAPCPGQRRLAKAEAREVETTASKFNVAEGKLEDASRKAKAQDVARDPWLPTSWDVACAQRAGKRSNHLRKHWVHQCGACCYTKASVLKHNESCDGLAAACADWLASLVDCFVGSAEDIARELRARGAAIPVDAGGAPDCRLLLRPLRGADRAHQVGECTKKRSGKDRRRVIEIKPHPSSSRPLLPGSV